MATPFPPLPSLCVARSVECVSQWVANNIGEDVHLGLAFTWQESPENPHPVDVSSIHGGVGVAPCVLSFVQVAVSGSVLVVPIDLYFQSPSLQAVLEGDTHTKALAGLTAPLLRRMNAQGITLAHVVDVGDMDRRCNRDAPKKGLAQLCTEFFGDSLGLDDQYLPFWDSVNDPAVMHIALPAFLAAELFGISGGRLTGMVKRETLPCPLTECDRYFGSVKSLTHHHQVHHRPNSDSSHRCPHCIKNFRTATALVQHIEASHTDQPLPTQGNQEKGTRAPEPVACGKCDRIFSNVVALAGHQKRFNHAGFRFACEICSKLFDMRSAYEMHREVAHATERNVSHGCPVCLREFSSLDALCQHQQCVGHALQHSCIVCFVNYPSKDELEHHFEATQHDDFWLCQQCPKKFSSVDAMQKHVHSTNHVGGFQARDAPLGYNPTASQVPSSLSTASAPPSPSPLLPQPATPARVVPSQIPSTPQVQAPVQTTRRPASFPETTLTSPNSRPGPSLPAAPAPPQNNSIERIRSSNLSSPYPPRPLPARPVPGTALFSTPVADRTGGPGSAVSPTSNSPHPTTAQYITPARVAAGGWSGARGSVGADLATQLQEMRPSTPMSPLAFPSGPEQHHGYTHAMQQSQAQQAHRSASSRAVSGGLARARANAPNPLSTSFAPLHLESSEAGTPTTAGRHHPMHFHPEAAWAALTDPHSSPTPPPGYHPSMYFNGGCVSPAASAILHSYPAYPASNPSTPLAMASPTGRDTPSFAHAVYGHQGYRGGNPTLQQRAVVATNTAHAPPPLVTDNYPLHAVERSASTTSAPMSASATSPTTSRRVHVHSPYTWDAKEEREEIVTYGDSYMVSWDIEDQVHTRGAQEAI